MAAVQILKDYRILKDSGDICTDGAFAFFRAGTAQGTTLIAYADKELSIPIGVTCSAGSLGYPTLSGNRTEVWVSDQYGVDVRITGTGVTTFTNECYTQAATTEAEESDSRPAAKNMLVNPGFALWSYGTSFANISGSGASVQVADGWFFAQASTASNSISQSTADAVGARYGLRFGRPNGSSNTNMLRVFQAIATDEAIRARSQTITLSFSAKKGADFSASGLTVKLVTGAAAGEDPANIEAGGWTGQSTETWTQTLTTTITRYQFSRTVAAGASEIGVQFGYTGVGTASANDYVELQDVQIEIATAATEFEALPASLEYDRIHPRNAYGATLASASTVELGRATGDVLDISGTTTITSFGTATAGIRKTVRFTGALQIAHNATSMILPSGANIKTVAGDSAGFVSLGSGNWRCEWFQRGTTASFSATLSANQTGIVDNTATKITFNTEGWDVGSHFDATNNRWTPPAGKVRLNWAVRALPASGTLQADNNDFSALYKNGSLLARGICAIHATRWLSGGSYFDDANGTDYYEVYVSVNVDSGTVTVDFTGSSTYFQGQQL